MTSPRRVALAGLLAIAISAVAVASLRPTAGSLTGAIASTDSAAKGTKGVRARTRTAPLPAMAVADTTETIPVTRARGVRVRSIRLGNFRRDGEAEPRSLQVIAVPVPAELGSGQLGVSVTPQGRVELISGRKAVLEADTATDRASMLVARVPAGASAGPLKVAEVEFANDTMTATVTVELTVARIRRVTLRSTRPSTAIYPGNRLHLTLIAQNLGNAPDTLRLTTTEIPGWRLDRALPQVVLAPGEQREISFTLRTPPPPASGTVPLRFRSMEGAQEIAGLTVPVELIPDPSTVRRLNGPTMIAGVATSTGDTSGSSPVLSMAVDGPLNENVSLRGRVVLPTDRADFNLFAMGRIGYFLDASYLSAMGRGWSATAGRTGFSFSPLFGWNAYGLGASGMVNYKEWGIGVLASQERYAGMRGPGGNQLGLTVGRVLGQGQLTATAVHLEQRVAFDRSLDALGLTYAYALNPGMTVTGEAGYRSSEAGSGAAASARFDARSSRGSASVYAAHAPGGSGAFARASDEINGNFWRQLSERFALRGFAFGSKDDPGTGTTTRSSGASIGPTFRLDRSTTLNLDVSGTRNKFDGDSTGSGSSELMTTLGARSTVRGVNLRASFGAGTTTRSTTFDDGSSFDRSGGKMVLRGGADTYTPRGTFALDASYERNDPITGQVPSMMYVGVNATTVRIFQGQRAPTFNASVWTNVYAGAPENGPALRIGADIPLPSQFALTIDAERNPYLRGNGWAPWVTVFRLERVIGLPGLRHASARGSVFDDRNGNGVRDADEQGMGGVLVRHGSESMLTDANGRFRFYDKAPPTTVPAVDMSSLAIGQMAPTLPPSTEAKAWSLPVMRTARLQVILAPTADSVGRIPTTPLTELAAVATDSSGAVWIAHPDSAGVAVFDALPSGHYTITVDVSGSTERLRQLNTPPVVEVTAGQEIPAVSITFGFRPVRVFEGGAAGAGGRRR